MENAIWATSTQDVCLRNKRMKLKTICFYSSLSDHQVHAIIVDPKHKTHITVYVGPDKWARYRRLGAGFTFGYVPD